MVIAIRFSMHVFALLVVAASVSTLAIADDLPLEEFFGVYVGVAEVLDEKGQAIGERHVDMVVEPDKRDGFKTTTIAVTLADGQRDKPGVKRDVVNSAFVFDGDGVYLASERGSLFSKKKDPDLIAGDVLRWARIKDRTLSLFSFVIEPDGRYELQITDRTLTAAGIDLSFRRYLDGIVVRTVAGRTVRVD